MDDSLQRFASALGVQGLTSDEQTLLLDATREVAHATQRRYAPLAAYLAGVAVGRSDSGQGLADALAAIREVLRDAGPPAG